LPEDTGVEVPKCSCAAGRGRFPHDAWLLACINGRPRRRPDNWWRIVVLGAGRPWLEVSSFGVGAITLFARAPRAIDPRNCYIVGRTRGIEDKAMRQIKEVVNNRQGDGRDLGTCGVKLPGGKQHS